MSFEPRTLQAPASVGACLAALAIEDAVGILHGGAGCDMKLHTLIHPHDPSGQVHTRVQCTKLRDADLVVDPAARLASMVRAMAERLGSRLAIVTSAGFVEASGLDHGRLEAELNQRTGIECVYVYAPDTGGDLFDGYSHALAALAARFGGGGRTGVPTGGRVNLLGYLPDRPLPEHRANLAELGALLGGLGLTVNATLLDGSPAERLRGVADADLSVALPWGVEVARGLRDAHGIPWVDAGLPIGLDATRSFLARVGEAAGVEAKAAALADEGERRVLGAVRSAAEPLQGRRVALFADGPRLKGLLGLCRDLRMVPVAAGVLDGRVAALDGHGFERLEILDDPGQPTEAAWLERAAAERAVDLVVGPWPEVSMARRAGLAGLEFGFPCRDWRPLWAVPTVGYAGALATASRMVEAVGRSRA